MLFSFLVALLSHNCSSNLTVSGNHELKDNDKAYEIPLIYSKL